MAKPVTFVRWALLWRSHNALNGKSEYVLGEGPEKPVLLFQSRQDARDAIEMKFGYIRQRPDLQREPHGWRMPLPVRVKVLVEIAEVKRG